MFVSISGHFFADEAQQPNCEKSCNTISRLDLTHSERMSSGPIQSLWLTVDL